MLNKDEQEILDGAQEGDTYYITHSVNGALMGYSKRVTSGMRYHIYNKLADLRKKQEEARYACCVACNHEWKEPKNVDVNSVPCPECGDRVAVEPKKQAPTVWDAVNWFEVDHLASQYDFTRLYRNTKTNGYDLANAKHCNYLELVCTIEEFNQCVDDLAKFANLPSTVGATEWCYKQYRLDYPQPKPRMKINYELVDMDSAGIAKAMIDGETFYNEFGGQSFEWKESRFVNMASGSQILVDGDFYRKVETEIDEKQEQIDSAVRDIHSAMFDLSNETATDLVMMLQVRGHLAKIKQGE